MVEYLKRVDFMKHEEWLRLQAVSDVDGECHGSPGSIMLIWTTEKPTKEGWCWFTNYKTRIGVAVVEVTRNADGFLAAGSRRVDGGHGYDRYHRRAMDRTARVAQKVMSNRKRVVKIVVGIIIIVLSAYVIIHVAYSIILPR